MCKMQRMWVNQPSTQQEFHAHHGKNVLVEVIGDESVWRRVWFTTGRIVSMNMRKSALSIGWEEDA